MTKDKTPVTAEEIKEHITYCVVEDGTHCAYLTNHRNLIFQGKDKNDLIFKAKSLLSSWQEMSKNWINNGVEFLEVSPRDFNKEYHDLEDLKNKTSLLQKENEELKEQAKSAERPIDEEIFNQWRKNELLKKDIEELERDVSLLKETVKDREYHVNFLSQKRTDLQESSDRYAEDIDSLQKELVYARSVNEELVAENQRLGNRYNDISNTKAEGALLGQASQDEAYNEILNLKKQLEESKTEIDLLRAAKDSGYGYFHDEITAKQQLRAIIIVAVVALCVFIYQLYKTIRES